MKTHQIDVSCDPGFLRSWIGRSEIATDMISARQAKLMAATVDFEDDQFDIGSELPPLWTWIYFLKAERASNLGRDGHPVKGGFLPPVGLPRRMWAGGRFVFHNPVLIGMQVEKRSIIRDVVCKQGRSGALIFVTVQHDLFCDGLHLLEEQQDIVYREAPKAGKAFTNGQTAPEAKPDWQEKLETDSTLLFRYSALTFNGHRIHYDANYARDVEGYEGLVVHGPLIATLLVNNATKHRSGGTLVKYEYRGIAPMFVPGTIIFSGKSGEIMAMNQEHEPVMKGFISFT